MTVTSLQLDPTRTLRRGLAPAQLAGLAVDALIAEATLTPKPGLVDLRGPGAHDDMDVETLIRSAESLRGAFTDMAEVAAERDPSQCLREELAAIGRRGEAAMFAATGGVNTHRGAIWALGLVVAAASGHTVTSVGSVLERAAATARFTDRFAPVPTTPGSRVRARYRISGAVGEARSGFPHAVVALDVLEHRTASGTPVVEARLDALLAVMATLDDTCLLNRGDPESLHRAQTAADRILQLGGTASAAGAAGLHELDEWLTRDRLSPGGSADMLALALLLHSLGSATPEEPTSARKDH